MAPVPENLDKYFQQLGRKIILELVKEIRLHESQSENPSFHWKHKDKIVQVLSRIQNFSYFKN